MTIVEADVSHIEYLADFGRRSFVEAYQSTLSVAALDAYAREAFSESTIRTEMASRVAQYFVCLDSALKPCGYAKLIRSPVPASVDSLRGMELQRLYVDSDYQGLGVGKRLAQHAESYAKDRGMTDLWLRVWDQNTVAQSIYKKWAFSIVGDELYQVEDQQRTVLLMKKALVR